MVDIVDQQCGGITTVNEIDLTLDTNAYADGDLLADVQEVTGSVRIEVGTGVLHSIVLLDKDDNGGALDIAITKSSTSWGTENDAFSITDAIADDILYYKQIAVGDYIDLNNSQMAIINSIGVGVVTETGSDSLYVAAVARSANTYTAAGISLKITVLAD